MKKKTSTIFFTVIFTLLFTGLAILIYLQENHLNISLTYNDFYYKGTYYNTQDIYSSLNDKTELYRKQEINLQNYQNNSGYLNKDFETIEVILDEQYSDYITLVQDGFSGYLGELVTLKKPYLFDFKIEYNPEEVYIEVMNGNIEKKQDRFKLNHLNNLPIFSYPSISPNTEKECIYVFHPVTYTYIKRFNDYLPDNCYKYSKHSSYLNRLGGEKEYYYYIFATPIKKHDISEQENPVITIDLIDSNKEFDNLSN